MSILSYIIYSILLYFLSRTVIWYWTYHMIDNKAMKEASIRKQEKSFITLVTLIIFEILITTLLSPIIGLILMSFSNADTAMRNTLKKTSERIKDTEEAKRYYKAAIALWEIEVEKERGKN